MSIARVKDHFRACRSTSSSTELTCAALVLYSGSRDRVDFCENGPGPETGGPHDK